MKNWLINLKIKGKLNLMIGLAILALLILGLTANFLIKTTKVVNIMLIAQRDYMMEYHKSLENFYLFRSNPVVFKDSLTAAIDKIGKANVKLELFSDVDLLMRQSNSTISDSVRRVYQISGSDADLLVGRVRLFNFLRIAAISQSSQAALNASKQAQVIQKTYMNYIGNSDSTKLMQDHLQLVEALNSMSDLEQKYAEQVKGISNFTIRSLRISIVLLVLVLGLLIYFLSKAIANMIIKPVEIISGNLTRMAVGDLSGDVAYFSRDEIGQLGESYNKMKEILASQVDQARRVATGDFNQTLIVRSEKDELTKALNGMTISLKEAKMTNDRENWIKTAQNELNTAIQGDIDLSSAAGKITGLVSKQLEAFTSALFVFNEEKDLIFIAGYAVDTDQAKSRKYRQGEGLIGQAVADRKSRIISEVPEGYLDIYSGLGRKHPACLMIVPCVYNRAVEGVLEIGSLKPFSDTDLAYINLVSESIAVVIQAARSRSALQEMLVIQKRLTEDLQVQQEELRQSNEELQVQQEELRQSNEELETQTRQLEESKAFLQAQQEELRVTNEELAERTKAIENQRESLRKKNDELERARQDIEDKAREIEQVSTYKSEFLANMSHELRTPLNSILVLSQILAQNKTENLNERQIKSAETIKASGENLLVLINEILDLAKIESGKAELHAEPIEVASLLADLKETFLPIAEEKGLQLEISASRDAPAILHNDTLRLGQILRNLIANGLKFTEKGSVRVMVRRPLPSESNDRMGSERTDLIGFYVEDSGIGIHSEKQKEIFDAFRQADGTTSRKFGGTGLGLAISRNFARMMGGDIILKSEPGKGSSFLLLVPENITNEPHAEIITSPISSDKASDDLPIEPRKPIPVASRNNEAAIADEPHIEDDRRDIRKGDTFLLIIEDDVAFARIIYDLAHEKNFKCMIAPNGETGLHYADYYHPSAIILDIGLPGINGWEVMKRLQENPNTRQIPVHFMSGSDKSIEAMRRGAIGFLRKPVSVNQINEAFDKIEGLISKPLKKLLLVEDDEAMRLSINELIGEENIRIVSAGTGQAALELLRNESFDAMILDLGLEDMTGYELLQKIGKRNDAHKMPVIIYTGRELTREDEEKLQSYSDRIIIKGIKSPERLLAETTLFLHQVESNLPEEKQKMLRNLHPREDVMKDKTVLIVDDDMRNVFALTSLLEDLGIKILVGKNGRDGIDKLNSGQPDLILMDIMMPEMNGYEAMEAIRKDIKHRKLPIIALTAKAMPGDREKCFRAGASDYLTKPIDPEKLISLLRVWLYKS